MKVLPFLMVKKSKQKVFVGMSGGVDSSVSAFLLQKAGYDVVGVFIKTWHPDFVTCTEVEDRRDAIRVAAKLGIPLFTFDLEREYRDSVGKKFIADYGRGLTPNPDVLCNREIKFGGFWRLAKTRGADFIATGHYAGVSNAGKKYNLSLPKDNEKDQTYFLWTLTEKDLEHVLFPLSGLTKPEVRAIAKREGLFTATKKDSQGVCFLGDVDMKEFLGHYHKTQPGKVLDTRGKIIGSHNGALFFTLGERHGFTIKGGSKVPYFVVAKDVKKNTLTVSPEKLPADFVKTRYEILSANFIGHVPRNCFYRARYREPLKDCVLTKTGKKIFVEFKKPELYSPGQSIVFYDSKNCLGGGIIK